MACLVLGDSIAVGVGQNRPDCATYAQVGINSERYVSSLMPSGALNVETAVISLGVNDDASLDTLSNLREVRGRITGQTVYWLLPGLKERAREIIRTVAAENGDRLIDTRPEAGPDHLHPTGTGYRLIASMTYGDTGETEVAEYQGSSAHYRRAGSAHRSRHVHAGRHGFGVAGHGSAGHGVAGHGVAGHAGAPGSSQRSMRVAVRLGTPVHAEARPGMLRHGPRTARS